MRIFESSPADSKLCSKKLRTTMKSIIQTAYKEKSPLGQYLTMLLTLSIAEQKPKQSAHSN
jgi:hypothetical protein